MTPSTPSPHGDESQPAKPRADAARNRAKLIDAARAKFVAIGVDAPLEKIAQAAGVGIGTLYRHFPTRADLVQAVYAQYTGEIVDQGWKLLETGSAHEALTGLSRLFIDSASTKHGMKEVILAEVGSDAPVFAESVKRNRELFTAILDAGAREGSMRGDVSATDLHRLIAGIAMTCNMGADDTSAEPLIAVVVDGLRPPA